MPCKRLDTSQALGLKPVILVTWEAETVRIEIQDQHGQSIISTNKLGVVVYTCHPSYVASVNRKIEVQVGPGINVKTYLKITKAKRTGDMAQLVPA
jgi:hypothetical protein